MGASLDLDDPVDRVSGIGARYAQRLAGDLGIEAVRDLIEHYPRRYDDIGEVLPLALAQIDEPVTLVGTITDWEHRRPRRRGKPGRLDISEATVRDRGGTGTFIATFFNQRWRERQYPVGTVAAFSGTLEHRYEKLRITQPGISELAHTDAIGDGHRRLVPVYRATDKLPTWRLAQWIEAALDAVPPFQEFLPPAIREHHDLIGRDEAVRGIHAPEDPGAAHEARRRLVFDELFTLQIGLQWRRVRLEADAIGVDNAPVEGGRAARFIDELPFAPTGAQRDALDELAADLAAERPMHRLLQGDVGSGKTLVATWTMLCAVDHGRQAALMAPTEVLAEQHLRTLTEQLAPLGVNVLDGIRVELLTSSVPAATKRRVLGELLSGEVDLVVGTHALLEEGVAFRDLGVVVVDEQHRFGVHQRVKLKEKGREAPELLAAAGDPDVLVMTATPIPRSLALTLFGDLDVTTLDELPPGRQEITTQLITPAEAARRERLYGFVRSQAADGLQTYIVCPLVEESAEIPARAVETEFVRLRDEVFPDLEVGFVHGQMRSEDKEAAMTAFRQREIDVLVATTVIEVGVDVPTATVMAIEDAERFGISQLHQLRGRVGRSTARSFCVLFAGWTNEDLTDEARTRLEAVVATSDGFELAETDLELRGEGQLFGVRQSGLPDLKLARLIRDKEIVELTRDAARRVVAADPDVAADELRALRAEVRRRYRGGLEELEALATG